MPDTSGHHVDAGWRLTLSARHPVTGPLVPDAMLAAMALEHGVAVASSDGDFARFAPDVDRVNPLSTR